MRRGYNDWEFYYERVYDYMRGRLGEHNAVTANIIERECGVPHTNGNSTLRRIISMVCDKYDIPIISNTNGYFVASTREELMDYLLNLELRIKGIIERKDMLKRAFESYNNL